MTEKLDLIDIYSKEINGMVEEYASKIRKEYKIVKENGKGRMDRYLLDESTTLNILSKCSGDNWEYKNPKDGRHILEIGYCLGGSMEMKIVPENRSIFMEKGDMFIYVSNDKIDLFEFEYKNMNCISIHMDILKKKDIEEIALKDQEYRHILDLIDREVVYIFKGDSQVDNLARELYNMKVDSMMDFLKLKMKGNMYFVRTMKGLLKEIGPRPDLNIELLNKIEKDIHTNISEPPKIKNLEEKYSVSAYKIQNLFKGVYDKTYYEYVKGCRVEKGRELLEDRRLSILEIAYMVGYENPSKFTKAFKGLVGKTPRDYRKTLDFA